MLLETETEDKFLKLSPESVLLRWVNYHLEQAGTDRRCKNFTSDILDSKIYTYLLYQIAPKAAGVNMQAMEVSIFI